RAHGGGHPRMIRFLAAHRDYNFGAVSRGPRQLVFELARLVAATADTGVVVPLDQQTRPAAERLPQTSEFFERSRIEAATQTWNRMQTRGGLPILVDSHHDHHPSENGPVWGGPKGVPLSAN